MHGLGNDFVILDSKDIAETLSHVQIQQICDRNFGVGCDQLVVLYPSENADIFVRFYNPDGSESAACGNATRCVADIVMNELNAQSCAVETDGGVLPCTRAPNGLITVDMGAARDLQDIEIEKPPLKEAVSVDMGNPHCVFFVDDVENFPVEVLGPKIENSPLFPNRTNVEFVQLLSDGSLRQRTWERGAGETLACGSGACAVAAAAMHKGFVPGHSAQIELNGGTLSIEQRAHDGHLLMTGPVAYVFDGALTSL